MPVASKLIFDTSPTTPLTPDPAPSLTYNAGTGVMTIALPQSNKVQTTVGGTVVSSSLGSGHVATAGGTAPTAAAFSGSNNVSVSVASGSTDVAGQILFTTPGSIVAGGQITLTFGATYGVKPVVTFSVESATATNVATLTQTASATAVTFNAPTAGSLTASQAYIIHYEVVGIGAAT